MIPVDQLCEKVSARFDCLYLHPDSWQAALLRLIIFSKKNRQDFNAIENSSNDATLKELAFCVPFFHNDKADPLSSEYNGHY